MLQPGLCFHLSLCIILFLASFASLVPSRSSSPHSCDFPWESLLLPSRGPPASRDLTGCRGALRGALSTVPGRGTRLGKHPPRQLEPRAAAFQPKERRALWDCVGFLHFSSTEPEPNPSYSCFPHFSPTFASTLPPFHVASRLPLLPNGLGPTDLIFSRLSQDAKTLVHALVATSHVRPIFYAAKGPTRKLFFFP